MEMKLSYQDVRFSLIHKNLGLEPKRVDFLENSLVTYSLIVKQAFIWIL